MKKLVTLLLIVSISGLIYAADPKIKVLDKDNNEPIPYANVCFEEIRAKVKYYEITSIEGIVKNPVQEKSIIAISFVGYKTLIDTIKNNESKTYLMEQDLFNMEQVVITGTRTRKVLSKSPILTKVVTSVELQETGAVTALDALEYSMPGVQFSPDGHGDNLQIQGLDNDYILVLVNGERMVGETRGNVNFSRLNAENIKQIEIVNGASSVLYGSNAIGAVINIITKENNHIKPFQATISSRYSKYNTLLVSSNVGISNQKFNMHINGFRSRTDGYDLTPQTPASYTVDKNTDYSGKIKLGYKINDVFLIKTYGSYYQHKLINPEQSTKSTHKLNKNYTIGGKVLIDPNERQLIELKVNTDIYNSYTIYEKRNDEKELKSDYQYSSFLLTDTYIPVKELEIVGGTELNLENIYSSQLFGETRDKSKDSYDFNVFLQLDYSFLQKFEAIAGVRYTYHTNYGNHITPKISIMYSPGKFKFRGNIAKGYKAPTLKELHYNFDHNGMFMIYGNPDLKPENAFYTSLSAEYTKKLFNISVNIYSNTIKDKIESIDRVNSQADMLEKHYMNISEALLKGLESYISLSPLKNTICKIGYAYSDAKDESTSLQLYGNSTHSGTFALTYKISKIKFPLSINLNGRASSGRLFQYQETEENPNTGEEEINIYKEKSEAYSIWKLTYNQQFKIRNKLTIQTLAGVNNVFDYKDMEDLAIIDPGRRFFIGLKIIL
ncbi:MAG: TonB-dependent receptor [Bacteroidales bacterium]|nr:TonB-dependent receptor [Bacteroidales bacterium]